MSNLANPDLANPDLADPNLAGGFVPTDIDGLRIWVEADRGITTVSGDVSAWADQYTDDSEGATDANQSTAGDRPLFIASHAPFGGAPAVQFDKSNTEHLNFADFSVDLPQPITYSMLVRVRTLPASGLEAIMDKRTSGNTTRHLIQVADTGYLRLFAGSLLDSATGVVSAGDGISIVAVVNRASSALYVDDMATPVVSGDAGANPVNEISLAKFAGGSYSDTDFYGYTMYSAALDESQRTSLKDYWQGKTGVPA